MMTRQADDWRYAGFGLMLMLVGCVTPEHILPAPAKGDASWRLVVPKDTVRYQLAMGEISSGGTPIQRVAPIYPGDQLAACPPPQEVPATLIVDQAGKVDEVRVADEASAGANRRAFVTAVRVAARQWQFDPLQINHWAADADGNSHVVDSETKPFSQTYVFRFECHDGKSTVSAAAAQP
ncbi:MAG TPA: hypothetical protein VGV14_16470 [Rhodanobacter sp.]|nr:hypothetical protein [Rhodanobacter sp.]